MAGRPPDVSQELRRKGGAGILEPNWSHENGRDPWGAPTFKATDEEPAQAQRTGSRRVQENQDSAEEGMGSSVTCCEG